MKAGKLVTALVVWLMALCGMTLGAAHAATVVYEDVGFIRGVGYSSDSFTVGHDGTYRVTLTDFEKPYRFDELSLTVSTFNSEIGTVTGSGWFDFNAMRGVTYYASLFGVAGGRLDLGLYGIGVESLTDPSPVPVPASLVLLASALVALTTFRRRNSVQTSGDQRLMDGTVSA